MTDNSNDILGGGATRPRRICMVTFSFYESDNRVIRYAESLAEMGDSVEVLALRRSEELPREEVLCDVRVIRLRDRFDKSGRSKLGHLLAVLAFLREAERWIQRNHAENPYDIFHIHNMPDFLVFAAWRPKRQEARVILDIHDLVPELYANKFGDGQGGLTVRMLLWTEKAAANFADHVIVSNHLWREKFAARTGSNGRCSVMINHVDSSVFVPARERSPKNGPVLLFPGSLQWHQGVDIAIEAFARIREKLPTAEFHIYGDGIARDSLKEQVKRLGLDDSVRFYESLDLRGIARVMAQADLGIVPKRADSFGNEAYSTKIMEFMSVGVPVVISSTRVDRYYFDDSIVKFFESGNPDALAEAALEILQDEELRAGMVERARDYVVRNAWQTRKAEYLALVDSLLAGRK